MKDAEQRRRAATLRTMGRSRTTTPTHAALLLALVIAPSNVRPALADRVTLAPADPGGREYSVEGAIADYRGDALVLRLGGGGTKSYPTRRVVRIETDWPAGHTDAQRSMGQRDWPRAIGLLTAAGRAEQRPWARRAILVDLLRCRLAAGQWRAAGELLITIDADDPKTLAWRFAPLPWFASDAVGPDDARQWLARSDEAARLLGAAWLLNTSQRGAAQAELRSLARSRRPAIATLAECQLWRLSIVRADESQADRWASRLKSIPSHLTAGPQHLLAQAYLRQKRYDEAALAALEAPLTGRAPHRLAARGLLLAAKATQSAGHQAEPRLLLTEITRDYADTPQRLDAEAMLDN